MASILGVEFFLEEFADEFGVGFAAADFHDCAAEEAGAGLFFLGVVFGVVDGFGVGGEGFVDPFFGGAGVADLDEAFGFGEGLGVGFGGFEKFFEDGGGGGGGDGAVVGEVGEFGVSGGGDSEFGQEDVAFVGGFGGDAEEEVGEAAGFGAGFECGFEEFGVGAFFDEGVGFLEVRPSSFS